MSILSNTSVRMQMAGSDELLTEIHLGNALCKTTQKFSGR
jgi:hypothetical protein